ncbi:syntaxin 5 [Echinococcus multilocularis]|uniref:Syntaxin 5 n=1 Tax=Echinococcus multilocularis TaxID=6211 RepID=A0A087VY72_ECHMU|nr:syntaxin 5 [Echinococcus multilocularis]
MNFGADRTADFIQLVNTLRTATSNGHIRTGDSVPSKAPQYRALSGIAAASIKSRSSQFARMAALISSDLAVTCSRLESLSTLARQRTLFDDHSAEVQHLTLLIREDIANLNHRIADLSTLSKSSASSSQQQSSRHATSVLMNLQSRLAGMSERFKRVLEQRSKTLRDQTMRKSAFSSHQQSLLTTGGVVNQGFEPEAVASSSPSVTSSIPTAAVTPSILLQDEQRARQAIGVGVSSSSLLADPSQQQQMTLYRDQTDAYLAARHDTVRTIEHTIVELGEIFQQLATMVHEQEERVERIDANVEESLAAVESGHAELLRYLRSVSSNRWLMFKVFGVLLFFFVFFVVFFV